MRVIHLGTPLGPAGTQLLARAVEPAAGHLEMEEDALAPVEAEAAGSTRWLPAAVDLLARARRVPGVRLCITSPKEIVEKHRGAAEPGDTAFVRITLQSLISGAHDVTATERDRWRIVPVRGACPDAAGPAPSPSR